MDTPNILISAGRNLEDFPKPPLGKTGWPWEQTIVHNGETPCNSKRLPRISVVIPSYNQGNFIEATIRSVLLQQYPDIELIVIDGASTDNTVEILQHYAPWISYWISEPDRGQSHAVNKGLKIASGQLIGWQNSDDYYHPETFRLAASTAETNPHAGIFYGNVDVIDANGRFNHQRSGSKFDIMAMLPWPIMFNQSMLFRRQVFDNGITVDESYRHHMDQALFWTLIRKGYQFEYVPNLGASFRIHAAAKGNTQFNIACSELFHLFVELSNDAQFPAPFKAKTIESMRGVIQQTYSARELALFRSLLRDFLAKQKLKTVTADLFIKYMLSFGGRRFVEMIYNLKLKNKFLGCKCFGGTFKYL